MASVHAFKACKLASSSSRAVTYSAPHLPSSFSFTIFSKQKASKAAITIFHDYLQMTGGGRPKKPRLSRMDAAIDAMRPLGFPVEKIKKHVKQLLQVKGFSICIRTVGAHMVQASTDDDAKNPYQSSSPNFSYSGISLIDVYGGDGWPFIEESSYKELMESLLCDEEVARDDNEMKDESILVQANLRALARVSDSQISSYQADHVEFFSARTLRPRPTLGALTCSSRDDKDRTGCREMVPYQASENVGESSTAVNENSKQMDIKVITPRNTQSQASSSKNGGVPLTKAEDTLRQQRFWHGWIRDDEEGVDDADEFVVFQHAYGELEPEETISTGTRSQRKRNSRWEKRPDDP